MQIKPHESLAVLSIRHDVFGPGRLASIVPGQVRTVHIHHQAHTGPVRVVAASSAPSPADCSACDRGGFPGFSSDPPAPAPGAVQGGSITSSQGPPGSDAASAPNAGQAGQGFDHGQAVPGAGSLLDVMA